MAANCRESDVAATDRTWNPMAGSWYFNSLNRITIWLCLTGKRALARIFFVALADAQLDDLAEMRLLLVRIETDGCSRTGIEYRMGMRAEHSGIAGDAAHASASR